MGDTRGEKKSADKARRGTWSWYVLWAALLVVSLHNLTTTPVFAKWVVLASIALALVAALQAKNWSRVLGARGTALAWCVLAVFCFGQLLHFEIVKSNAAKYGFDFSAYYLAGKVVQERPAQSLYDLPLLADGRMNLHTGDPAGSAWDAAARRYNVPYSAPFIYPPFFAVLMVPFAHLSYTSALTVWNAMAVLLAFAAVALSFRVAGVRMDGRLALLWGVGLLSCYPLQNNIDCGQIGGVILFLFAAGVWLLSRERVWLSALSFAVATLIKLTPVLVVPILVIRRRWRWLAAYALWMAALAGLSMAVTGWSAYAEFWHKALPAISCGSAVWENTSIVGWVQELFLGYAPNAGAPAETIPMLACRISKLVSMAIYGGFLLWYWMRRGEQNLERAIVAMALLGLAISPISWWHHYTLALLPVVYLWCTMRDRVGRVLLGVMGVLAGTNLLGIVRVVLPVNAIVLALAAITPLLTIAVALAAIAEKRTAAERSGGAVAA